MNNIQLHISHESDGIMPDESLCIYRDMIEGFVCSINDIGMKQQEFKQFLHELSDIIGPLTEYDYSRSKNSIVKRYINDSIRIYTSGNSLEVMFSFYTKTEDVNKKVWDLYRKHSKDESGTEIYFHSFYINGNTLDSSSKNIEYKELDYISNKYYPYIDTDIMFDQFFTGAENILLMVGEPGLGKSKMSTLAIKHAYLNSDKLPYDKLKDNPILENQFITIVYVKSTDVLIQDKFWRDLSKISADICIIDDLDYMLTKRDAEVTTADDVNKNTFLNHFLSFTDGVEKNRTKFIITTNQRYDDIDIALLRKGRLFDILELRHLDYNEALDIWKDNNLEINDFNKTFKSHRILPADLGSEINKRKNDRIATAMQSYLKEDGISKIERAGRSKKIGL